MEQRTVPILPQPVVVMMKRLIPLACLVCCGRWDQEADPYDLDFEVPRTEAFAATLSAYDLYAGDLHDLTPADGVVLYELASELYTDQAYKQRLLKLPADGVAELTATGLTYPEGTIIVKTFYYPIDMTDPTGSRLVLETRLLIKREGQWNVATYLWNETQTEAELLLDGTTRNISWTDATGAPQSTEYGVPHEGECVTCHQTSDQSTYIGPTVANLHRDVTRDGAAVNQLDWLVAQGVLPNDVTATPATIPDYQDPSLDLETQARSYLHGNCAHCHHPEGWDGAARPELDLRFETPLATSGILRKADDIQRQMENGTMPHLGVSLPDQTGIDLVTDFLDTL